MSTLPYSGPTRSVSTSLPKVSLEVPEGRLETPRHFSENSPEDGVGTYSGSFGRTSVPQRS